MSARAEASQLISVRSDLTSLGSVASSPEGCAAPQVATSPAASRVTQLLCGDGTGA